MADSTISSVPEDPSDESKIQAQKVVDGFLETPEHEKDCVNRIAMALDIAFEEGVKAAEAAARLNRMLKKT